MMMQRLVSMSSVSLMLLAHPQPGSSSEETTEVIMLEPNRKGAGQETYNVNLSICAKIHVRPCLQP